MHRSESEAGRVVVGVDDSSPARAALAWAVRYAVAVGATVEAVAVWREPLQTSPIGARPQATFEERAEAWLAGAVDDTPGAVDVIPLTVVGHPGDALVRHAAGAALLVLGHSREHVAGTGSVGQHCLRHAPCPVVLVPVDDRPRR